MNPDFSGLASDEFFNDPYPFYEKIREADRLFYFEALNTYWLTGYDDVSKVLTGAEFGKNFDRPIYSEVSKLREARGGDGPGAPSPTSPASEGEDRSMLFLDPPKHTRLRQLVLKAFTPSAVDSLKPFIEALVDQLLKDSGRRGYDIISEFAGPLPALVIAEMLGVPPEDRQRFKEWSDVAVQSLDSTRPPEEVTAAAQASMQFANYFSNLIEDKRRNPGDDLITSLIAAEESGDRLSYRELLSMCELLLIAGHETTTNLIGNGFLALLRNRDQMQTLVDDPPLTRGAVEEFLRYDPPVQMTKRITYTDVDFSAGKLKAGSQAVAVLAAANRDPGVFDNPGKLDVTRKNSAKNLSFGKGIHFCLGAPLARLEGEMAFKGLVPRLHNAKLVEHPRFRRNLVMRGVQTLVVASELAS